MKAEYLCRCCLSETCYKDISNEYYRAQEKEVYSDMLFETFNLKISHQDTSQCLICEDCIVQLRSAASFKKQVLRAEEALTNKLAIIVDIGISSPKRLERDDFIDHITGDFEDESDTSDVDGADADCAWPDDEGHPNESGDESGDLFMVRLEPTKDSSKRKTTKFSRLKNVSTGSGENSFESNEEVFQNIEEAIANVNVKSRTVKVKPIRKMLSKRKPTIPKPQSQIDMKENSLKLLNNSNMCLFESLKTRFRCFYCKESYFHISELREHSKTHSNPKFLKVCFDRLRGLSYKNVDISSLSCGLCSTNLTDLKHLQDHLKDEHDIQFVETVGHLLISYRLENGFQCVMCSEEFNTFYRLSIHSHTHYSNNVCEICGVSYINRLSLRTHVHAAHREKKCSMCSATFASNYLRLKHMRKMHNSSAYKRYCLQCNKTFPYTYMLVEHRIQEHGVKRPVSNCSECGKSFLTPQNLKIHIRSVHVRERNHPCGSCGMRFFTTCDQRRHERTHQDVRSFACSYCEGRFKSKDSLRRHLKRQHGHLFITN